MCDFFPIYYIATALCCINRECRNLILNKIVCSNWGTHLEYNSLRTIEINSLNIQLFLKASETAVKYEKSIVESRERRSDNYSGLQSYNEFKLLKFAKGMKLRRPLKMNKGDFNIYAIHLKNILPMFSTLTYLNIDHAFLSSLELTEYIFNWIGN